MHTVFALLCFVVVIHWLIFPYPLGLLHWHCGNLTIASVPAKQPWWIWINTSCEFIMNDCITTTKQSTTKPCAYFLGYTVCCDAVLVSLDTMWELSLSRHKQNYQLVCMQMYTSVMIYIYIYYICIYIYYVYKYVYTHICIYHIYIYICICFKRCCGQIYLNWSHGRVNLYSI